MPPISALALCANSHCHSPEEAASSKSGVTMDVQNRKSPNAKAHNFRHAQKHPQSANNDNITALCKIIKYWDMYQYLSYKSRIEKLKKSLGIQASKLCIFEEIGIW